MEQGSERRVGKVLLPQPRRELLDLRLGMAVDALEHVDEAGVGIDVVERAGGEQALDLPDLLRAEFGPAEEPVLSSHRDHAQRPLEMVRVERDVGIGKEDLEPRPSLTCMDGRLREGVRRKERGSGEFLFEPGEERIDDGLALLRKHAQHGFALSIAVRFTAVLGRSPVVNSSSTREGDVSMSLRVIRSTGWTVAFAIAWLAAGPARSDGPVVGWGNDLDGQATPPVWVNGAVGTATAIAAGGSHSCAIRAVTGNVVCWGRNDIGQATPPPPVNGGAGTATAISAGDSHTCAIQAGTGKVVCWGNDVAGGATPPPSVDGTAGTATAIAAGGAHSCAIRAGTGNVICWGFDLDGQATPPPSVDGTAGTATAIVAGATHSCAIRAGTANVVCWGRNDFGQATPPSAVNGGAGTATAISALDTHSCAIQSGSAKVVCWGSDVAGQATPPPRVDGTAGTATAITAGGAHSCAIRAGTENVICWGFDFYGQATPPPPVDGTAGTATAIAAGGSHTLAIAAPEPSAALVSAASLTSLLALARRRASSTTGSTAPMP